MFRKVGLLVCLACASAAGSDAQAQSIRIESGSYGANCGAREGNATRDLAAHCDALETCRYEIDPIAAAPRQGQCAADLVAEWSCGPGVFHRATVRAAQKHSGTLVLTCVPSTGAGK
ncbi:hypothetical protein [Paraburkholderia dinghuensis]|uniref:hypothetical protein n=1 Tax=Paraburkholderia dinghuensis TaxID=2305225 RepID=UPI001627FF4B|nr:hypothetical protein [Paraburkholderia dinghuensis]